jgi:hypothetical protein
LRTRACPSGWLRGFRSPSEIKFIAF